MVELALTTHHQQQHAGCGGTQARTQNQRSRAELDRIRDMQSTTTVQQLTPQSGRSPWCRCRGGDQGSRAKKLCRRLLHWISRRKKRRFPAANGIVFSSPPATTNSSPSEWVMKGSFAPRIQTKEPQQPLFISEKQVLGATWPQPGPRTSLVESSDEGESGFEDDDTQDDGRSSPVVKEWNIPWDDLQFGDKIAHGRHRSIYKGRWHGEVFIHTFSVPNSNHVQQFLRQVNSLAMIRHENLALFMGACVEPYRGLAIVTSMRQGPSLSDSIHLRRTNMNLPEKIRIAHQIAQAMGYLHAKGIVHSRLTSRNVFLEGRVQVSLLDHGLPDTRFDRDDYGCLPRCHLSYLSPELMRSLRVNAPSVRTTHPLTEEADVYAFGTLLYELLSYRWPLQNEAPHTVIWRIGSGVGIPLDGIKCPITLKEILVQCWTTEPKKRPLFPKIVCQLERSVALQRRYSSSEPERLNRLDQRLFC